MMGGRAERATLVFIILSGCDLHLKQIQLLRLYVCVTCVVDQFQFLSMALCIHAHYLQKNNCGVVLLRRRMEDEVAATQAALEAVENDSLLSPAFSSRCILPSQSSTKPV